MFKITKIVSFILILSILAVNTPLHAERIVHKGHNAHLGFGGFTIDNINIDFDDDDLTVTNTDEKSSFKIDKKFELYINKEHVKTTPEQRKLTKEMYRSVELIIEEAKDIGWDGAKIGAEGAKLGIHAILCVFKLLSPDYDTDDLEAEIEKKAKKLEKKADKLELRAELIEDMARELEDISDRMREKIPELKKLSWF